MSQLEIRNLKNENARLRARIKQLETREPFNGDMLTLSRDLRGLTRGELAEATKISVRTIKRFERGLTVPTEEEIEAIAEALQKPKGFYYRTGRVLRPDFACRSTYADGPEAMNE